MATIWTYDSRDSHNFIHVTRQIQRCSKQLIQVWGCHKRQNGLGQKELSKTYIIATDLHKYDWKM